ncbi:MULTISPECIES: tripartite tricarboxylate transporter permease [Fusobacterium]|jgi:tricarboxylate transport membrane protein rctA|uniref:C4-dicarboxylate ABC transporter permease n=2 Tax=Fusobacterium TaxID=848 RepID=A0A2G9EHI2_9FUSO|nr:MULTISPECIES: tripartite tricarboxylate transporter permease [Fusobacterium]ATV69329.1 C4-dicarboxylate ABC transporter permease [Fusobacterium pseudoperiodonticum]MBF1194010.1 tripartite tricarboxylate transporter permease [Fusobacterium periodonticum]MBF1206581.1 tripartite tricarboxylate transporter permease [Fusobacterium periodonticum]MBF1207512.1 tripartite tricarboxylate transporter permease [Fusobacterium periodonticum]MBF1214863.1 tripartite tricarboxylate transporter permease [Fus
MSDVLFGYAAALTPINLVAAIISVAIGITIGALPGLSAAMGVALLIPITFGMDPSTGLITLAGVYCGAIFGGSISAILIRTPGTPAAAATAIDGYELTKQGKAGTALGTAITASFIGGILSAIPLYLFAPRLAKLALLFGPAEYFWLSIFGLTIIAGASTKSIVKGLISGALGLMLSTVGMDPMLGNARFTFGVPALLSGIPFTAALIGLFSMSQVLMLAEKKIKEAGNMVDFDNKVLLSKEQILEILPTSLRSTVIGSIIGILPGAGASIAAFLGYNEAKRFSKKKELFGHGSIEGIAGAEAANNAVTGGSLIPTFTLGIPGESVTAVLLGGLMIQGLQPGPDLFTVHGKITYTFFAGFVIVNIFMLILGLFGSKLFAKVSRVSDSYLIPLIFALSVIGSYAINNQMADVWVMFVFGIIGYFVQKFELNSASIVLALILGPIGESGLRRSLILNHNNYSILFQSTVSKVLLFLTLFSLLSPIVMAQLKKRKKTEE